MTYDMICFDVDLFLLFPFPFLFPLSPQVAWLQLQPRPLSCAARLKAELLRRLSDAPRIRLAAKSALTKADATAARVEVKRNQEKQLETNGKPLKSIEIH